MLVKVTGGLLGLFFFIIYNKMINVTDFFPTFSLHSGINYSRRSETGFKGRLTFLGVPHGHVWKKTQLSANFSYRKMQPSL